MLFHVFLVLAPWVQPATADIVISCSDQRPEIMRLLHEIAARVEEKAIAMGFCNAKAFAGGSCKDIFCPEHLNCNAVSGDGVCRHPRIARPSMSGYGINVSKLIKAAGWPSDVNSDTNSGINSDIGGGTDPHDPKAMSWVAGLIVIS